MRLEEGDLGLGSDVDDVVGGSAKLVRELGGAALQAMRGAGAALTRLFGGDLDRFRIDDAAFDRDHAPARVLERGEVTGVQERGRRLFRSTVDVADRQHLVGNRDRLALFADEILLTAETLHNDTHETLEKISDMVDERPNSP